MRMLVAVKVGTTRSIDNIGVQASQANSAQPPLA
jgi:hypothetical protein